MQNDMLWFVYHILQYSLLESHKLACNKFTNIDGKACNNIPEEINKLALSAHLGHSREINMISLISLNKTQSFSQVKFELSYISTSIW